MEWTTSVRVRRGVSSFSSVINPRRACAARVTVVIPCVCVSVCVSVYDYSRTTDYEAAYERYQHIANALRRGLVPFIKNMQ